MDFSDFRKAVAKTAKDLTPAAVAVAPAFKFGTLVVLPFATAGAATPFLPFLAVLPDEAFLPLAVSVPLFALSPEFRRESTEVDYTRLGEMAATEYLKRQGA